VFEKRFCCFSHRVLLKIVILKNAKIGIFSDLCDFDHFYYDSRHKSRFCDQYTIVSTVDRVLKNTLTVFCRCG
jgi:hypothetical protein